MPVFIDPETGRPFDPSIPTKMGLAANNRTVPFNTGRNITDVLGDLWDASKLAGLTPEFAPIGGAPNIPVATKMATQAASQGTKAGAREIAKQIENRSGVFGKLTVDPKLNIIPVDVAKKINMKTTLPQSEEFASAVQGTKNATITPEGLQLSLQRFQKPEQELSESVRTGVFYLPKESESIKFYKGKGTMGGAYGGNQIIQGETLLKNPLFIKGATGGRAPEQAYKKLVGMGNFYDMQNDLFKALTNKDKGSEAYMFLEKYAPEIADNAWHIVDNSKQGNQLKMALQEAVFANEARKAGYDSILGYSTRKKDNGNFISEIFDLRESHYPSPSGEFYMHPEYEGLLGK